MAETCSSTETELRAVAGNKTVVQKTLLLTVKNAAKMKKKNQLSFGTLLTSGFLLGRRPLELLTYLLHGAQSFLRS